MIPLCDKAGLGGPPVFTGSYNLVIIYRRCSTIADYMLNEQIRDKEVMLIDADGTKLGVMSVKEAQFIADEKHLDLVKIAPNGKPPVCKIMDYSKFKFESEKKRKEERKRQKTVDLKEIRLSSNIDTHDVNVKIKRAIEFLKDGDKVKVSIRFRYAREMGRTDNALQIMRDFAEALAEYAIVEKAPRLDQRNMIMFLTPKAQS